MTSIGTIMRKTALTVLLLAIVVSMLSIVEASSPEIRKGEAASSWIVKWHGDPHPEFIASSTIHAHSETFNTYVATPELDTDVTAWLERWMNEPDVGYVHPNQQVQLQAVPNDELYGEQSHLRQIRAPDGWDIITENTNITIAIVDTGIDLEHPDLQANLVAGVNLVSPGEKPQDDHGHGTNVAGVIAASGNNATGVAGLLWKARIMPVKAIEADGLGEEDKLGEGIRYAVDNGAKIVVLCVGLKRYSPYLQEVAQYAESRGVLLVSATGKEGAAGQYPAAYPSVLAVGGVGSNNTVMLESNYGPEVDIVAPWRVYTTALGGGYEPNQGTSMAAPQAAGAAALLWAKFPNMRPYEIRSMLQQTAQDIESRGWDPYAGYGLLRVDRALRETFKRDMHEPNDRRDQAKQMPIDALTYAELTRGTDIDWFFINAPYDGTIELNVAALTVAQSSAPAVTLTYYASDQDAGTVYRDAVRTAPVLQVKKGTSRIRLQLENTLSTTEFRYSVIPKFTIYRDMFEDNDRQFKAYLLPARSQTIKGTFHQINDQDWFMMDVTQEGSLQILLSGDSVRMDLAMMIQKAGENQRLIDRGYEGLDERLDAYDVTPGRYYLLVSNVISDMAYPVTGEYTLKIDYSPKLTDPNEPNDRYFQATPVTMGTVYNGLIDTVSDNDWFSFTIREESYVEMSLHDIPKDRVMLIIVYDSRQTQLYININTVTQNELYIREVLQPGTYYVKLGANRAFQHQFYRFAVKAEALLDGFRDIKGHWAEKNISRLIKDGAVSGYGDYTFRPNQALTRAEAAALISNAFKLRNTMLPSYTDVARTHWAYASIGLGTRAGVLSGYEDGSFRPDQSVTRAEMAVMIGRAMKLSELPGAVAPFTDVPGGHWSAPWLRTLLTENIVTGYRDGSFRPNATATRAEFVTMLAIALN